MIPRVLELGSIQPKAYQPYPKGEQLIIALRLAHDGAALGDSLGRHGKAQIHIGGSTACVESGVKTAEFDGPPEKHGMEIERIVPSPVVVLRAAVIPLIPDGFQLCQIFGFFG